MLAVDGRSGAGKSALAAALRPHLPDGAAVLAVDDLHPGWDGLAAVVPLLADGVLAPLARGRPGRYRRWDWRAGAPGPAVDVRPPPVLVLEGAGCGAVACAGYASLLVWVDADPAVRRQRALARDGGEYAPHWQRWSDQEEALTLAEGTPARADVVLDTSGPEVLVVRAPWAGAVGERA